ncbi:MAG TPA: DUF362 domain-containing protein [Candidatus Polarisedimenticolaceae bacterium]|nr:DUF362 domain-containing protein [Candidatus Polarisedimenticolaceae bacterium]
MNPFDVVACRSASASYPGRAPFSPGERYPESPFPDLSGEPNAVYETVRRTLRVAGLDAERFGTAAWNPLGRWIRPGDTVMLKPNMVKESHPRDPDGWRYVLTHGSVIRAVADFVAIALSGSGRIWLADAPQTDSSWERIVGVLELDALAAFYRSRGVPFELVDLRREEWTHRDGVVFSRRPLAGDPRGYVAFDLGEGSEFFGHRGEGRYYGADYVTSEVNAHHSGRRHEYLISGSAVAADVFINLPKLKTHKKAGITCSLKNLVGINGDKNWLPHHTVGDPTEGGDEVPSATWRHRLERRGVRLLRETALALPVVGPRLFHRVKRAGRVAFGDTETVVRSGNWFGNDTTWRMCLDLNKALLYGRPDGALLAATAGNRKRYLSLVDGIVAGEGRGPMNPDPVACGIVLFGEDPVAVDTACAVFMGFDPDKIPIVREAYRARGWRLTDVDPASVAILSDEPSWRGGLTSLSPDALFRFRPHFGWTGRIEAGRKTATDLSAIPHRAVT